MYGDLYPQHFYASYIRAKGEDPKTDKPKVVSSVKEVPQYYLDRHPDATYNEYIESIHDFLNGL